MMHVPLVFHIHCKSVTFFCLHTQRRVGENMNGRSAGQTMNVECKRDNENGWS